VLFAGVSVSLAQDDVGARMSLERIANIRAAPMRPATRFGFSLDRYAARYLLRFDNEPRSTLSTPIMVRWADSC